MPKLVSSVISDDSLKDPPPPLLLRVFDAFLALISLLLLVGYSTWMIHTSFSSYSKTFFSEAQVIENRPFPGIMICPTLTYNGCNPETNGDCPFGGIRDGKIKLKIDATPSSRTPFAAIYSSSCLEKGDTFTNFDIGGMAVRNQTYLASEFTVNVHSDYLGDVEVTCIDFDPKKMAIDLANTNNLDECGHWTSGAGSYSTLNVNIGKKDNLFGSEMTLSWEKMISEVENNPAWTDPGMPASGSVRLSEIADDVDNLKILAPAGGWLSGVFAIIYEPNSHPPKEYPWNLFFGLGTGLLPTWNGLTVRSILSLVEGSPNAYPVYVGLTNQKFLKFPTKRAAYKSVDDGAGSSNSEYDEYTVYNSTTSFNPAMGIFGNLVALEFQSAYTSVLTEQVAVSWLVALGTVMGFASMTLKARQLLARFARFIHGCCCKGGTSATKDATATKDAEDRDQNAML